MNVSAWSIKNPIPAVMLFVLLTFAGLLSFNAMKVQNFPDLDLPTVTVVGRAARRRTRAAGEPRWRARSKTPLPPLQGLKNIYTKVQDGGVTITAEFRLEKPTQEAVDDVRSRRAARARRPARRRARPDRHQDEPVGRSRCWPSPSRSPRMDDEALSWFVDNTVSRALLAVRGVGSVNRVGGVTRAGAGGAGPAQAAGPGRHGGRHLAPAAPGADRKRRWPRRPGRQRATHAHPGHGAIRSKSWPPGAAPCPTASACGWTRWPPSPTPWPSRAPWRCSTASRWWALRSPAARAPARWKWAPPCRAALAELQARSTPTWSSPRPSTS